MSVLRSATRPGRALLPAAQREAELSELDPPLHVDWLEPGMIGDQLPGRLGLTFLPGKRGRSLRYPGRVYRRELDRDLAELQRAGVDRLLLLVTDDELARWGDPDIVARAVAFGIEVDRVPMPDGGTPDSLAAMDEIAERVGAARRAGRSVAVACMGGVGRSGMVVACLLVSAGSPAAAAIAGVRAVRHPLAVETARQESYVTDYAERSRGQPG